MKNIKQQHNMSKNLTGIAQQLKDPVVEKKVKNKRAKASHTKKVQLIYAFNGVGKTRLSREFKELIAHKTEEDEGGKLKVVYYNAFTEDLFYWENNNVRKLMIRRNDYTRWILKAQGKGSDVIDYFQKYTNDKLNPRFNEEYSEVTFSFEPGDNTREEDIKISKGEESIFIWIIFFTLLEEIIATLNVAEPSDRNTDRYEELEYVFIDDPVSSLDENHLIELAVNLAKLIKESESKLKFIITTHNPLFYNVLHNELGTNKLCYLLKKHEDGTFDLTKKKGDSNTSFSYHLHLKALIEKAIKDEKIEKFHFTLLRNLYEKTASFLGYPKWSELLPDEKTPYYNRIIQFTSHNTLSNEAVAEPTTQEKETVAYLLNHLHKNYHYYEKEKEKE